MTIDEFLCITTGDAWIKAVDSNGNIIFEGDKDDWDLINNMSLGFDFENEIDGIWTDMDEYSSCIVIRIRKEV